MYVSVILVCSLLCFQGSIAYFNVRNLRSAVKCANSQKDEKFLPRNSPFTAKSPVRRNRSDPRRQAEWEKALKG